MVIQERAIINGREFNKHYSNAGYRIKKVGTNEIYDEAFDLVEYNYTYEETEELIGAEDEN